jgi:hypothetical protein
LTLLLTTILLSAVNIRPAETAFHEPGLGHAQQQLKLSGLESSEPPEIEWNQTYGGAGDDCARSVVQTAEGGYALAGFTNSYGAGGYDFWLVKTDANGNAEWNKTYGGASDDWAWPLVQTVDGGYALAGHTIRSYDPYDSDFWLVKTDSEGNMQWNKTYGGAGEDYAYSLIQTHDEGYALAGSVLVKTDSSGNMQWNRTYEGSVAWSVMQKSDEGYVMAGYTFGSGSADFWLVKTDAFGNIQWEKAYGGANWDRLCSAIETSDGGYALIGYNASTSDPASSEYWDALLIKTDSGGNQKWNKTYSFLSCNAGFSIIQTYDGGYTIAGYSFWRSEWVVGLLLFKTDSSGNLEWNITYAETWESVGWGLVQTADGGCAVAAATYQFDPEHGEAWLIKIKRARIPGDINADGTVNVFDAVILSGAAGSEPGDSNWNPNADINSDNIVDLFDAVILSGHAGEREI